MSSDTNRADRGALFQLSNFGMRSLSAFRRRAATFPADECRQDEPIDEYGFPDLLDLSSVCSHSSVEGREYDSSIDTNHRHYESPANPNASNENPMICFNNTYNGDTQLARVQSTVPSTNERLRLPIGQSPIGHHLQHLNEGSPVRPMHVNSSHWENTPNSSPMSSVFSNSNVSSPVSSIVTPMALYNGLHVPVRQVFNYGNLYPLYSGNNPFYERSNWPNNYYSHSDRVEEMAKSHRNAATHADARHTWSGSLPNNSTHKNPVYSCKVFLGGVPWEMTDHDIKMTFSRYNVVTVLRPGKDVRLSRASQDREKAGYLYLILESDKSVKSLLNACTHDFSNGGKFYYPLNQPRFRPKDVQVIPWNTYDSTYVKSPSARLDNNKTVFVGALHGMLTAEGLATILEDLFGGVVYVGIDTDKFKYPIGSGRVTFSTTKAYTKAVHAGFIDVKANRFTKKIQIDPFLEESNCSHCRINKGPFFCRDLCMRYLCRVCWDVLHSSEAMKRHQPLMRLLKDYIRELPEPLFTKALFDMMDDGLSVCLPDDPAGNAKLMFSILECLPKINRCTVFYLMDHFKRIMSHAERNKMSSQALAICFGPLFTCHSESESLHKPIEVFKFLLEIWPERRGSASRSGSNDSILSGKPLTSKVSTKPDQSLPTISSHPISSIAQSIAMTTSSISTSVATYSQLPPITIPSAATLSMLPSATLTPGPSPTAIMTTEQTPTTSGPVTSVAPDIDFGHHASSAATTKKSVAWAAGTTNHNNGSGSSGSVSGGGTSGQSRALPFTPC